MFHLLFQAADTSFLRQPSLIPLLLSSRVDGKHEYGVHLVKAVTLANRHWGENVGISLRDNTTPTCQEPDRYHLTLDKSRYLGEVL